MRSLTLVAGLLAALPLSVLSMKAGPGPLHARSTHELTRRDDPGCQTLGQSSEGRKIALVVDSSGSNVDTDPNDLRVTAAKAINSVLVTQAGPGGQPDLVTVVDFDDISTVIYPLGSPAGATFDSIDSSGGTYIAGGLQTAIDELTKNAGDPTAHRSGIVVLTDGEDSSITDLIDQLNRAQTLGIRVAFGFLSPVLPADSEDLLTAILNTGGIYGTIDSPEAQQNFVSVVLAHGLTDGDGTGANGNTVLFPGVSIAANISASTSPQTFLYNAQAAEKLNFTVTSVSGQALDAKVHDVQGNTDLGSASTNADGVASIVLDAPSTGDLEFIISTTNATGGLLSVGVKSNLNRTIGVCGQNSTGTPGPTGKPNTPSPTSTAPISYFTGAASTLELSHSFVTVAALTVMGLLLTGTGAL